MEETKIISLYKGTIKIKFVTDHADKHKYYDEKGNYSPGVTYFTGVIDKSRAFVPAALKKMAMSLGDHIGEVLTQEMIDVGKNEWGKQSKEAKDVGTEIHAWISEWIKTRKVPIPERLEVKNGINAFMQFQDAHKVKWLESERLVYSKKHKYPGTADAIGKIGKDLILFDFKSTKPSSVSPDGIYPEHSIQAAGYQIAWEEETGKKMAYRIVIALHKETGDVKFREFRNNEKDKKTFLHCVGLRRGLDELKPNGGSYNSKL
jgi:hypothetical protein